MVNFIEMHYDWDTLSTVRLLSRMLALVAVQHIVVSNRQVRFQVLAAIVDKTPVWRDRHIHRLPTRLSGTVQRLDITPCRVMAELMFVCRR